MLINHYTSYAIPIIKKYNNLLLNNNIKKDIIAPINNAVYNKNFTAINSGKYFKYIIFNIPFDIFDVSDNDILSIDCDILSKNDVKGAALFMNLATRWMGSNDLIK